MSFVYRKAVLRQIPASLPGAALRQCASGRLPDLERSRDQHRQYEDVIRSLVPEVHVLPADDAQPDCCFVEDTVVVCGETALVTIPGSHVLVMGAVWTRHTTRFGSIYFCLLHRWSVILPM